MQWILLLIGVLGPLVTRRGGGGGSAIPPHTHGLKLHTRPHKIKDTHPHKKK